MSQRRSQYREDYQARRRETKAWLKEVGAGSGGKVMWMRLHEILTPAQSLSLRTLMYVTGIPRRQAEEEIFRMLGILPELSTAEGSSVTAGVRALVRQAYERELERLIRKQANLRKRIAALRDDLDSE